VQRVRWQAEEEFVAYRDVSAPEADIGYLPPPRGAPEQHFVDWANGLPIMGDLNLVCTALTPDGGTFTVEDGPLSRNPNGAVHGGLVSAIADQCLGVVSTVNAPRERMSVTATLHGQFHRPAMPPLTIRATCIAAGRRLIFVECEIHDARGKRCSTFQGTMAVGGNEQRPPPE
jgi:uncharacterized protein (TIGR00369 family)